MESDDQRSKSGLKAFIDRHGQLCVNIFLFFFFAVCVMDHIHTAWRDGRLDYVEIAFAVQNLIMVTVILLRLDHKAIDRSVFHQTVALVAFFSGAAILGQPPAGGPALRTASEVVTFLANVLGMCTLLNLGRSFGILIALRKVKTTWLYGIIRHPMYATDILLRVGFLISHFSLYTVVVVGVSSSAYVYRAILEERFLSQQPEYREYLKKVRYRFIPYVF